MKLIVLAAGKGKRMRPLTKTTPKPLLKIAGKPILDYIFEALPAEVDSAIIVTKYLGEKIRKYCGQVFYGRPITYVDGLAKGTADDFLLAKDLLKNEQRFLFIYGDEFPSKDDIIACLKHKSSLLCWRVNDPWNHGILRLEKDGETVERIVEKSKNPPSNLLSNGVFVLTNKIFECFPETKAISGEFYFTDVLNVYVKREKVKAVRSKQRIGGISTPGDIKRVENFLKERTKK